MIRFIQQRISLKLFLSYSLVILVNGLILAVISNFAIPRFFNQQMMSTGMSGMMGNMESSMMGDLFLNFRAIFFESLLVGVVIAFFIVLVLSAIFSQRFVRPLKEMMMVSQRIAQGRFNERVSQPVSASTDHLDELGQLAVSFNIMAEKLGQIEEMRSQLMGDISHELRTPLSAIKGSMEALEDGILKPDPETFQQIHREAARLERLVDDLQELSRVEARSYELHAKKEALRPLVLQVTKALEREFRQKEIILAVEIPEDLPKVMLDTDRIYQVLHNLAGNALRYTPGGGRVAISARLEEHDVIVSIQDSGIGIPAAHLQHIFTRFYRVDKSRSRTQGGSGIGLTIARLLVEAHGGRIWAESGGEGQGSTFSISLPI